MHTSYQKCLKLIPKKENKKKPLGERSRDVAVRPKSMPCFFKVIISLPATPLGGDTSLFPLILASGHQRAITLVQVLVVIVAGSSIAKSLGREFFAPGNC